MSQMSWEETSKRAKNELSEIENQWKKHIELIGHRELSPTDVTSLFSSFYTDKDQFENKYQGYVDNDIMCDKNAIFDRLYSDLKLSIQSGQQNYRNNKQKHNLDLLKEIGKICVYLFVALLAILGILFGLHII